jgi:hypothetical protein
MTASAAAPVSFEESSGLVHDLAGIEVSTKQVERAAAVESASALDTSPDLSDFATRVFREATRRGFSAR